jgi:hypothetical protein
MHTAICQLLRIIEAPFFPPLGFHKMYSALSDTVEKFPCMTFKKAIEEFPVVKVSF